MDNINNSYLWKNGTVYHSKMEEYFCCDPKQGKTVCIKCNETKPIYSKFQCKCTPTYCEDCLENIKTCSKCNSNQYFVLSEKQIENLIKNRFEVKTVYKIFFEIWNKHKVSGKMSLKNLVAKASDITNVYESLSKQITLNYLDMNNIYSFAADIWKIPEKVASQPNTAFCYKTMSLNYSNGGYLQFLNNRWNCSTLELNNFELLLEE